MNGQELLEWLQSLTPQELEFNVNMTVDSYDFDIRAISLDYKNAAINITTYDETIHVSSYDD